MAAVSRNRRPVAPGRRPCPSMSGRAGRPKSPEHPGCACVSNGSVAPFRVRCTHMHQPPGDRGGSRRRHRQFSRLWPHHIGRPATSGLRAWSAGIGSTNAGLHDSGHVGSGGQAAQPYRFQDAAAGGGPSGKHGRLLWEKRADGRTAWVGNEPYAERSVWRVGHLVAVARLCQCDGRSPITGAAASTTQCASSSWGRLLPGLAGRL